MKLHFRNLTSLPIRTILLSSLVVLVFAGCTKHYFEFDKVNDEEVWDPTWAVPLIHSTIDSYDILDRFDDDELIVIDPVTGQLALRYFSEVFSFRGDEFIVIPNQDFPATAVPIDQTTINNVENNGSSSMNSGAQTFTMSTAGELIDTITWKNATRFEYALSSDIPYAGNVVVSIPELISPLGGAYTATIPFTANESNIGIDLIDTIAGYTWDLTNGGTSTNEFTVDFTITYNDGPGMATLGQALVIDMDLTGVEFQSMRGDIGSPNITTGIDSVRIRINENSLDGEIKYAQPSLIWRFTNTIGAQLRVTPQPFYGTSPVNGSVAMLDQGSGIGQGTATDINRPAAYGLDTIDEYVMDTNNSNLNDLLAINPERIVYDIDVIANPLGGSSQNFVIDSSRLKLDVIADLPLDGWARNFTKSDTVVYTIPDDSTVSDSTAQELVSLTIRLNILNGFPADGKSQVYFADSNYTIIDSLFANGREFLFQGGITDNNGKVVEKTLKTTDMVIDRDKVIKLRDANADRIILFGEIQTTDAQTGKFVKIFDVYTMDAWLGVKAQFAIRMSSAN